MRSYEDSLQRLGLPKVDILYVHDIGTMTHGERNAEYWAQLSSGGYRALRELKDSGAIKGIGLGVNERQVLMDALALGDWDVFLLAGRYTLLEQTSLSPLLEECVRRQTSIVVGGPFNGGALMGTGTWNYAKAPQEIIDRVHQLEAFCTEYNVPIGAAALQFPARPSGDRHGVAGAQIAGRARRHSRVVAARHSGRLLVRAGRPWPRGTGNTAAQRAHGLSCPHRGPGRTFCPVSRPHRFPAPPCPALL